MASPSSTSAAAAITCLSAARTQPSSTSISKVDPNFSCPLDAGASWKRAIPNPFFRQSERRRLRHAGDLEPRSPLRPFPQFLNVHVGRCLKRQPQQTPPSSMESSAAQGRPSAAASATPTASQGNNHIVGRTSFSNNGNAARLNNYTTIASISACTTDEQRACFNPMAGIRPASRTCRIDHHRAGLGSCRVPSVNGGVANWPRGPMDGGGGVSTSERLFRSARSKSITRPARHAQRPSLVPGSIWRPGAISRTPSSHRRIIHCHVSAQPAACGVDALRQTSHGPRLETDVLTPRIIYNGTCRCRKLLRSAAASRRA